MTEQIWFLYELIARWDRQRSEIFIIIIKENDNEYINFSEAYILKSVLTINIITLRTFFGDLQIQIKAIIPNTTKSAITAMRPPV